MVEPLPQRVLHKLYGAQAALLARVAALNGIPNRTQFAQEELLRCIGAKEHIGSAIDLLTGDPELPDQFQIELPY